MIGIVAEFNPYHKGHQYLIDQARLHLGDEPIVVCMSGDYVQRGEPAISDKFSRASKSGADLVLELPLPWCLSSAEGFARGAVAILRRFGCNYLAFGSECGNIDDLRIDINNEEIKNLMKLHPEISWPAARSKVINSDILNFPNNILGYEYLKFIGNMTPFTIKRTNPHDGESSAKELRSRMQGPCLENYVISRLKMFDKDYFNSLPESENGIGNRLFYSVGESASLETIYKSAKTKRITEAAIRRLVMCAALGIKKGMNDGEPSYARVLSFNEKGRELLKQNHDIKIIIKPSDINCLDDKSKEVFSIGASAHDFYNLGFETTKSISRGSDYRTGPFIIKY